MLQRSRSTGRFFFFPRVAAPATGDRDIEWVEACGTGVVYATTVMRGKPPVAPFNVALITLDEGPRVMSRVEGIEPDAVKIGMRVSARIAVEGSNALLVFDVVAGLEGFP